MFENFELTLVRAEGLGNLTKCKCNITLNDQLLTTIDMKSLETSQSVLSLPPKGIVRLSIEDHLVIASLRFSMKIIKCQGYHWLPLFTTPQDMIFEVPEEVGLPRVLLILQSQKFLSPVIEITETSEVSDNLEHPDASEVQDIIGDDMSKNVELRMRIMELEHALQVERTNFNANVEKITKEFKVSQDKTQFEMEKFRVWSEKYKEKANLLGEEVESKKKVILQLTGDLDIAREEVKMYCKKVEELAQTQGVMEKMLKDKEKEIDVIRMGKKELKVSETVGIAVVAAKKKRKQRPKLLNMSVENINPDITVIKNKEDSDAVDFHLQNTLNQLKLDGLFQRTYEHYYKVGCKKVGVVLKNNSIYCKFGDTYKTLENYIFSHCNNELENFIKKRANSKPGHKRFNSFSNTFDQSSVIASKSFKIENENSFRSLKNKSITPCLANRNKKK